MMRRLLPHPHLSLLLVVVWLALVNQITVGNIVLGLLFGIVVPILTAPYWPDRPRVRSLWRAAEYGLIVLWDIIVANVQVAMIILFRPNGSIRSHWVVVPLDLTSPEAITAFAGTITMTPGTVSATLSADGRAILVHCLDTGSPETAAAEMKARYERRLKEIFA